MHEMTVFKLRHSFLLFLAIVSCCCIAQQSCKQLPIGAVGGLVAVSRQKPCLALQQAGRWVPSALPAAVQVLRARVLHMSLLGMSDQPWVRPRAMQTFPVEVFGVYLGCFIACEGRLSAQAQPGQLLTQRVCLALLRSAAVWEGGGCLYQ